MPDTSTNHPASQDRASNDREIVSVAVHPGIGIARVGNSDEYFVGPEVPYPVPPPEGGYRDAEGRIKRQAARFRVYGYDSEGRVVREITSAEAEIDWRVHVANTKAAWYDFVVAMDTPGAEPMPRRNGEVVGEERRKLAITPPPAGVVGCDETSGPIVGEFFHVPVTLGELRTDEVGRLLFLGGEGKSGSPWPGDKPYTFGNNDGFYDDVCDGPVDAVVSFRDGGEPLVAKSAWVVVAPPNYAPDLLAFTNLYDVFASAWTGSWWQQKERPSFTEDIYPILQRFCVTQWVNEGFLNAYGWRAPYEFTRDIERLATTGAASDELRRQIFNQFRYPQDLNPNLNLTAPDNRSLSSDGPKVVEWPWFYGDNIGDDNNWGYMSVTELQYQYLAQWAAGDFDQDWQGVPEHPESLDEVPLVAQPTTLDRANMEYCLGGPFHPGCELTWPVRQTSMFSEPFRVRRRPEDVPPRDYGDVLEVDQVYVAGVGPTPGGPLYFNGPGDLTRWMAVPWQTDTSSCRSGYDPDYDPNLPTFWPVRVPNQVLTEADYHKVLDTDLPIEERIEAFYSRAVWYRFLGPDWDYFGQIDTMISRFGDLGLIERRPGPEDDAGKEAFPPVLYVETGVQFDQDPPADQGRVMLWRGRFHNRRGQVGD